MYSKGSSMRQMKRLWVLVPAFLAASTHGSVKSTHDSEALVGQTPPGFKLAFQEDRGGVLIQEFVPNKESALNWTAMVTVQTFKVKQDLRPGKFLVEFGEKYAIACPELSHTNISNGSANGYPTSFLAIQCPNNPATGKQENVYVRVIHGSNKFHVIQFAYSHPLTDVEKVVLERYLKSWIACDPQAPEHPCPPK